VPKTDTIHKILIWLIAAGFAYYATVFVTPYAILLGIKMKTKSEYNQPVYSRAIDETERRVVMPNPDFIYVAMGYDVRKHPVRITGMMPDSTYASVAMYASNTENYFVVNDRQLPQKKFDIILTEDENVTDALRSKYPDAEIVFAKSNLGTVMMRILITDNERIPYLKTIQQSFKAEVVR
jgi:uncharacterized membrane protein